MKTYKGTRKTYQQNSSESKMVSDIIASYKKPSSKPSKLSALKQLLSLEDNIPTDFSLVLLTRNGLKKDTFTQIASLLKLTQEELCALLHISTKTFQRIPPGKALDLYSSEQLIEIALVYLEAKELFATDEAIVHWLKTPVQAFGGLTPLSLLDTGFGAKVVVNSLQRAAQGIVG